MGAASKIADPILKAVEERTPTLQAKPPELEGVPAKAIGHWRQRMGHRVPADGVWVGDSRGDEESIMERNARDGDLCSYERGLGGIPLFLDEVGIGEARRVLVRVGANGAIERGRESPVIKSCG